MFRLVDPPSLEYPEVSNARARIYGRLKKRKSPSCIAATLIVSIFCLFLRQRRTHRDRRGRTRDRSLQKETGGGVAARDLSHARTSQLNSTQPPSTINKRGSSYAPIAIRRSTIECEGWQPSFLATLVSPIVRSGPLHPFSMIVIHRVACTIDSSSNTCGSEMSNRLRAAANSRRYSRLVPLGPALRRICAAISSSGASPRNAWLVDGPI